MNKRGWRLAVTFLLVFIMSGCTGKPKEDPAEDDGIFQYKDSYIGENSAVSGIVGHLKNAKDFQEMTLQTKEKPYGLTIVYNEPQEIEQIEEQQIALYNASYLFALLLNADKAAFDFGNAQYQVNKTELENWYGKNLKEFKNEQELETFLEKRLNDNEKVKQFFSQGSKE